MDDEYYMSLALAEARRAATIDEVPIGCVIVKDDQVIAQAHNFKEHLHHTTAHAEILAIEKANDYFGSWHLDGCTLYVTLEPCMMCTGAIIQSRISRVVIGAPDSRWPGMTSLLKSFTYNHEIQIDFAKSSKICAMILSEYFKKKRG